MSTTKTLSAAASRQQDLRGRLRAAGLRGTAPRAAVLDCLLSATRPLTHAEVSERLVDAGLDRVTVWRNLSDLTEVGILRRTDLGDRLWRFEIASEAAHEDEGVHPHFVCTECGAVSCLPDGVIVVNPAAKKAPRSMRAGAFEVQVRGACNACA